MQKTRNHESYYNGMPTKSRTHNLEPHEKWMETNLPKDSMAITDNRTNKRTRINKTKKKPKIDKWNIHRKDNRNHMANMDNKKQPNI